MAYVAAEDAPVPVGALANVPIMTARAKPTIAATARAPLPARERGALDLEVLPTCGVMPR